MVETSPDSQIAFFPSSALLLQVEPVHSRPRFFSGQALLIKYIKKLLIESPKSNIFTTVTFHRPEHFLVHFRCFQMRSISDSPSTPPLISFCCSGWKFGSNQIFHFKFLCKWQNSFQMSQGPMCGWFFFYCQVKKTKRRGTRNSLSVLKMSPMFCVGHVCLIFKNLTSITGLLRYSH